MALELTETQAAILSGLRREGVRYLIIGGKAMWAHGLQVRKTRDLDLWVARDASNAAALATFMKRVQNLPPLERLQQPNFKFAVGDPQLPDVEILTSVAGDPPFDEAYGHQLKYPVGKSHLCVVSLEDLIAIKSAAGAKHQADIDAGTLNEQERAQATGALRKETADLHFLRMWQTLV